MMGNVDNSCSNLGNDRRLLSHVLPVIGAIALVQASGPVAAVTFQTENDDLKVRWDNTVKYSAAVRLKDPSDTLTSAAVNPNNVNLDDGDRNFGKGLISSRYDLLTEFDTSYKRLGLRLSGAAWYDSVYNRGNNNPGFAGGAFPNQLSAPSNEFVYATSNVHGRKAELLDAFVYGSTDFSNGTSASFRLGRHGMVWGEALFFGANGIAGGMMPVDVVKLLSVPNTQFKEAIRPVPMISGQFVITPETSVGAYYQFRWSESRIPTVGSYFSVSDTLPDGAEQALLTGGNSPFLANAPRLADQRPPDSGQGGLQLRSRFGETDVGVYLIRYHDKTPQQVFNIGAAPVLYVPTAGCPIPGSFATGPASCALPGPVSYQLAYPQGITSLGFSASQSFDSLNLAGELSFRNNQPLTSALSTDTSRLTRGQPTNDSGNSAYPVARTAHFNVSAIWTIPSVPMLREASLLAEVGWNRVLSVTRNPQAVDPNSTRDAVAFRALLQSNYRQVLTGVDIAPLVGLGWSPKGSRSAITTTAMPQNGNGDLTLGADFTYLDVWRASLAYTHYIGTAGSFLTSSTLISFRQYYADRDFVAFSLRRSF